MKLSITAIPAIQTPGLQIPSQELFALPEKVLQFGTGVLSRGIPDHFIHLANSQGIFNGRIVAVSTSPYDAAASELEQQDGLFTEIACGVVGGKKVEQRMINASISRVLYAKEQWELVLACAANPQLQVIIADTAEVNLTPDPTDNITAQPPASFAGMLLAILYQRFKLFTGQTDKGFVIIPTELISQNGPRLEAILLELAHINELESEFMDWLENSNHFCHSLIDRVIPDHAFPHITHIDKQLDYTDQLQVISEIYCGWYIETNHPRAIEVLSFSKASKSVVIADDIEVFRELKLRLLNGVHTYTSGLSYLAGIFTVREAMEHPVLGDYMKNLMLEEIAPAIPYHIPKAQVDAFAAQVLDRFRNPYVEHKWLSICLHYSQKMKLRNLPVLMQHYQQTSAVPELMALGFAAHILFMKCTQVNGRYYGNGCNKPYLVQDARAPVYAKAWKLEDPQLVVHAILSDVNIWEMNLAELPGFEDAVLSGLIALQKGDFLPEVQQELQHKQLV